MSFASWLCALLIASAALFWLQTPSATFSETVAEANQVGDEIEEPVSRTILEFSSIEEIEAHLASDEKPTLVEFYSDFGFS